eukprot:comp23570_c2_seq1/m.39908 comp23570_c2_seq1/g.39908  ORF comp23570_c2_seq1/g.39908 comp23570_c2_seq1/m.39908 type:complete len:668 (-) comp23570_c2_seq1:249-2252(-)
MSLPTIARLAGRPAARLLTRPAAPALAQKPTALPREWKRTGVRAFSSTARRDRNAALRAAPGIHKLDEDEIAALLSDSEGEEGVHPDVLEDPRKDRDMWDMPLTERFNRSNKFKDAGDQGTDIEKPRSSNDYQMAIHYLLSANQIDRQRDSAPHYLRKLLADHLPEKSLDPDWLYPSNAEQRVKVMEWVVEVMKKDGYLPTVGTMHMLLQAYAAAGQSEKMSAARAAIKRAEPADMLADSTCLLHALKEGQTKEAWAIFQDMRQKGMQPTEEAYSLLMSQGSTFSAMLPSTPTPLTTYAKYILQSMAQKPPVIPSSSDIFVQAMQLTTPESTSVDFCVGVIRELELCPQLPSETLSVYTALLGACKAQARQEAVKEVWDLVQTKGLARRDGDSAPEARAEFFAQAMACMRSTSKESYLALSMFRYAASQWEAAKLLPPDYWENLYQTLNTEEFPLDYEVMWSISIFQKLSQAQPLGAYEALFDMGQRQSAGVACLRLLQDMSRRGMTPSVKCYQDTFIACKEMVAKKLTGPNDAGMRGVVVETALHAFNTMPHKPDYALISSLVVLLAQAGQLDRSMKLLTDMKPVYGVDPQYGLIRSLSNVFSGANLANADKHISVMSKVIDDYQITVDNIIVRNLSACISNDNLRIKIGQAYRQGSQETPLPNSQ